MEINSFSKRPVEICMKAKFEVLSHNRLLNVAVVFCLVAIVGVLAFGLGDALGPLMIAFALSYLCFPFIRWLERHSIKRNVAVFAVFVAFVLMTLSIFLLVLPGLVADARGFAQDLPQNMSSAAQKAVLLARSLNIEIDLSKDSLLGFMKGHVSSFSTDFVTSAFGFTQNFFSSLSHGLLAILNLFLIPLFFFYVINDYEKITSECAALVPDKIRPPLVRYLAITDRVLSGYLRGQLIVAALLGLLYGIGLWLVGLRFGFLIGFLSGMISIIPYAGLTLGFATAIMMALANFTGPGLLVGIVAVYAVVQALEGFVITPKLVGDKVGLSPFATILALIIGGNLFGLLGMLLAIPMAAILKELFCDLRVMYLQIGWVRSAETVDPRDQG
jgi:predicted PurR-regulated permease PerM